MKRKIFFALIALTLTVCLFCITACGEKDDTKIVDDKDEGEWWLEDFETYSVNEELLIELLGGYACGVCHPTENYQQLKEANINWVRFDINVLPYDKDGNLSEGYLSFKARAKGYADQGIKVMAVTPYPTEYIAAGLDPRDENNHAEIMKIARFYAEDLQGIVSAFQITNEMGIDHFTLPLTLEEAAEFIGIQLKAMYRYKGDIPIGYNLSGLSFITLNGLMQPYLKYADYVGADIYVGCFESNFKTIEAMSSLLNYAHSQINKPMLLNEFGYIGVGQKKTDAERLAILHSYGAQGDTFAAAESYARSHMREIIADEDFPPKFREHLKLVCSIDETAMSESELAAAYLNMGDKLFNSDLISHFYKELKDGYQLNDYPHTQEGQGKFYEDCFTELNKLSYLCGAFVYCYSDSDACYICGQGDCPVETGWGMVDRDGNCKPSYYAIQKAFADLQGK